jgi:hypothetical protein
MIGNTRISRRSSRRGKPIDLGFVRSPVDHAGIVSPAAALAIAGALLTDDGLRLGVASASALPADAGGSVHVHSSLANRKIAPPRVRVRHFAVTIIETVEYERVRSARVDNRST